MSGVRGAIITQVLDEADPILGFAVGWVNALAARVERLEAICLSRGDTSLARNVHVAVLPSGRFARYRRVRALLGRLKRDRALDFVLAHMCPSYAVAATFPTKHAPTFLWYAHSSVTRMLRMADRRCDRAFSCSTASYPLESHKLVVVGHGIDVERFTPASQEKTTDELTICSVGRITKSKRLGLLIEALARTRDRYPQTRFACRIVGPGDEGTIGTVRSLVARSGLGDVVRIEPPLEHGEVVGVYQTADVIANMTTRHSLDKATLEAMACGCLVLTTNDAFLSVLGEHAEMMVQADASADALARAVDRLAALDAQAQRRIGRELRDIVVRDHSLPRMMDRVVAEMQATRNARDVR